MSKVKEIEELIEKYYNGATSLEEESQLQSFFLGEDIPDHLISYKDQFVITNALGNQKTELTDDELFAKLSVEEETKVVQMKPQVSVSTWLYRVAAAVALIVVGYWAGNNIGGSGDVEGIKSELAEMKALMRSQLESSSASGRLQAVSNSLVLPTVDEETVDVLIAVMKNDENMHVRTKAIEALVKFGNKKRIRSAISDALLEESEPAVQIALIEAVVSLKEKGAIENLEQMAQDDNVLKDVQDEAHMSIFRLKEL